MNPYANTFGSGKVIVPSDTSTGAADQTFKALFVGGAGNIVVVLQGRTAAGADVTVTFTGVAAGTVIPIQGRRVNSTSTTATNMVGLD